MCCSNAAWKREEVPDHKVSTAEHDPSGIHHPTSQLDGMAHPEGEAWLCRTETLGTETVRAGEGVGRWIVGVWRLRRVSGHSETSQPRILKLS
jgi:hypothetical protein